MTKLEELKYFLHYELRLLLPKTLHTHTMIGTLEQELDRLEKLEKAIKLIIDYLTIANNVPLMTFAEQCFTEEEQKLLKEVLDEYET